MGMPDWLIQELRIPFYQSMHCDQLGMDSIEHCFDKSHFTSSEPVTYQFNEIGYRTKSVNAINGREALVIGDSFSLGLGVNEQSRWSDQLSDIIGYPVLNFCLNGASNDWIARRALDLLSWFDPPFVVIHWTFTHRREIDRPDWYDDERTECEPKYLDQENLHNWMKNFTKIKHERVIHSAIPNWHIDFDYDAWPVLPAVSPVDLARDGFHYGPKTHRTIAEKITNLLGDVSHLSL